MLSVLRGEHPVPRTGREAPRVRHRHRQPGRERNGESPGQDGLQLLRAGGLHRRQPRRLHQRSHVPPLKRLPHRHAQALHVHELIIIFIPLTINLKIPEINNLGRSGVGN